MKLYLQQRDFYGAWNIIGNLSDMDPIKKQTLTRWLQSFYELYHFQFEQLFSTLSEMYEEGFLTHEEFALTWDHWDQLIQHDGMTDEFLLDSVKDNVHHMELDLETGDYLAFLTRLYRLRELLILFLMMKAGNTNRAINYKPGRAPEYLKEIESYYLSHELSSYYGTYMFLQSKQLTDVIHLRNQSFIGHGHLGVTNTVLWRTYEGKWHLSNSISTQAFLDDMKILYQDLGVNWTINPYRVITQGLMKALDKMENHRIELSSLLNKKTILMTHLQQYRYQSLLNLVRHSELSTKLQHPLDFANALILGNLTSQKCNETENMFVEYATLMSKPLLNQVFMPLAMGNQVSFINYLLSQVHVFQQRHDYGQMLIRVYRLMEELMIYFLGYDVDKDTAKLVVSQSCKPKATVESHTFSGLMGAIRQAEEQHPSHEFYQIVKTSWWQGVASIHWHSIVGHGTESITKEHVEDNLGISINQLKENLHSVMNYIDIKIYPNCFDQFNQYIIWKFNSLNQVNTLPQKGAR